MKSQYEKILDRLRAEEKGLNDQGLFDYSLRKAQEMAAQGYDWIASLYINKARLYGEVKAGHLRAIGITQKTGMA